VGGVRGDVDRASESSMRRLRRFLMTYQADGEMWGVTLTVRESNHLMFRHAMKRFQMRLTYRQVACVWRLELMKREKRPHLHLVVWHDGNPLEMMREQWLESWSLADDRAHWLHAVHCRRCDSGWVGYLALHHAKGCYQSEGWEGRYWGVWCRDKFTRREVRSIRLPPDAYDYARRMLNVIYRLRGRKVPLPDLSSWDQLGGDWLTVKRCVARACRRYHVYGMSWQIEAEDWS
jgi:hypothetical protein